MSNYEEELKNKVPDFEEEEHHHKQVSTLDISATVSAVKIHGWKQILGILGVAVFICGFLNLR